MKKHTFTQHIITEIKTHNIHYLLMVGASVLYVIALGMLHPDRMRQFFVTVAFIIFYVGWGIIHHWLDRSLTFKTVLEYILIGSTVLILLEVFLVR